MKTFRVRTTVTKDGTLVIKGVPFRAGTEVEVVIHRRVEKTQKGKQYPLRGTSVQYIAPFESVGEEDWEVLG